MVYIIPCQSFCGSNMDHGVRGGLQNFPIQGQGPQPGAKQDGAEPHTMENLKIWRSKYHDFFINGNDWYNWLIIVFTMKLWYMEMDLG